MTCIYWRKRIYKKEESQNETIKKNLGKTYKYSRDGKCIYLITHKKWYIFHNQSPLDFSKSKVLIHAHGKKNNNYSNIIFDEVNKYNQLYINWFTPSGYVCSIDETFLSSDIIKGDNRSWCSQYLGNIHPGPSYKGKYYRLSCLGTKNYPNKDPWDGIYTIKSVTGTNSMTEVEDYALSSIKDDTKFDHNHTLDALLEDNKNNWFIMICNEDTTLKETLTLLSAAQVITYQKQEIYMCFCRCDLSLSDTPSGFAPQLLNRRCSGLGLGELNTEIGFTGSFNNALSVNIEDKEEISFAISILEKALSNWEEQVKVEKEYNHIWPIRGHSKTSKRNAMNSIINMLNGVYNFNVGGRDVSKIKGTINYFCNKEIETVINGRMGLCIADELVKKNILKSRKEFIIDALVKAASYDAKSNFILRS